MSDLKLGQIIVGEASRDAIHIGGATYAGIAGFNRYRVGSDGTVWSFDGRWNKLNPWPRTGYLAVSLYQNKAKHQRHVHVLVLESFIGPRPSGMEAAHDNGNPMDNRLSNLAWKTSKQNQADRLRHGTDCLGEKHWAAKITEETVLKIRSDFEAGRMSVAAISKAYALNYQTVYSVISRGTWRHV